MLDHPNSEKQIPSLVLDALDGAIQVISPSVKEIPFFNLTVTLFLLHALFVTASLLFLLVPPLIQTAPLKLLIPLPIAKVFKLGEDILLPCCTDCWFNAFEFTNP